MLKNRAISFKRINYNYLIILVGLFLELGVMTYFKNDKHYYQLPLIWFLGGIITFIGIFLESKRKKESDLKEHRLNHFGFVMYILGALIISYPIYQICFLNPPNPMSSDVVPTLQAMTERLMNFEYPYKAVQFPGWSFEPGYLTMQYLPFVGAEWLEMDYRFWAYIIFVVVIGYYFVRHNHKNTLMELIVLTVIPFVMLSLINKHRNPVLIHSVELLDVAFYFILAFSLFSKNVHVKGLALVICLLSRFGIIFFLPMYVLIHYWDYGLKKTTQVAIVTTTGIMILYVLPFMPIDPMLFFNGIANYDQMAVGQWEMIPSWYEQINKPYTIAQGFGFAIYFNDFLEGDTVSKINILKNTQIILCIMVSIVGAWYFKRNCEKLNTPMYLLAFLKIYLVFFYSLVFVPFTYLYLVPLFISLVPFYKMNLLKYD